MATEPTRTDPIEARVEKNREMLNSHGDRIQSLEQLLISRTPMFYEIIRLLRQVRTGLIMLVLMLVAVGTLATFDHFSNVQLRKDVKKSLHQEKELEKIICEIISNAPRIVIRECTAKP